VNSEEVKEYIGIEDGLPWFIVVAHQNSYERERERERSIWLSFLASEEEKE